MKKLLLFSLILIFSCKTKTVIEPKKSLAEICQDSFPCKIDSFYIKENDTIIETNYITNKDTLVLDSLIYINTETTKTIKIVIEKSVLIDYKTTPDYVILSDSLNLLKLNNSNLSDSLNNFKTDTKSSKSVLHISNLIQLASQH